MRRLILSSTFALLLAGCAGKEFAGIPLASGAASADLQRLATRAETGDKQALLALGMRFERGDGVPRDLARAEQLFLRAAESEPVYQDIRDTPVSKHGMSGVRRIQIGIRAGLPEARQRLAALRRLRSD